MPKPFSTVSPLCTSVATKESRVHFPGSIPGLGITCSPQVRQSGMIRDSGFQLNLDSGFISDLAVP